LLLAATLAVAAVVWREIPASVLYGIGALAITIFALCFYPVGKLLWLAVDLQFRPAKRADFEEGGNGVEEPKT
jgi:hypothetical protein